jgi:menaquinone-dependent protoporphyrinogen oxidase
MSTLRILESWGEGLLRVLLGIGLAWIGVVEGAGYGLFLQVVGAIFIAAGIGEIWVVEAALRAVPPAFVVCDIPVFYATTEGQTRRIAERLVALFREKGFTSTAVDVSSSDVDYIKWKGIRAAVVGASLHIGRHQRSARVFVRKHADDLNAHPSAFFSVSLAAASPVTAERDEAARLAAQLPARASWHPEEIDCLAGRCAYTQYGWITRLIMKWISRRHGAPTDTSKDYEFTNWDDVTRLADRVVRMVAAPARQAA